MDKRIAIPAGLAIMVALAVIGVMSIIGFTATNTAEASISDISQDIGNNVVLAKLTEPFASPLNATLTITGPAGNAFNTPTIQQSPDDPGVAARYTIKFYTSVALANGIDDIVFHLDSEFQVPATLDRNQISISSSSVTGGAANEALPPLEVTVDLVGSENNEPEITLVIGDMDTSNDSGGNGIAAGAEVTVIFRQAAGIKNPTEQGFDTWSVRTSQDTTEVQTSDVDASVANKNKGPFTPAIVEMSSTGAPRGKLITLIGKGFEGGITTTFWLDADADGARDTGEIDLCSATTASSDIATCTFTVNNPPFVPATFATGGTCTGTFTAGALDAGVISLCNFVNARDGEARTVSKRNQVDLNRSIFSLDGLVEVSPNEGNPGDTVTVQLKDYVAGALTSIDLAGVAITTLADGSAIGSTSVPTAGELNFTIKIPDGVPSGKQTLTVETAGTDENTDIIVGSATLLATPSSVVGNQRVSIIGNGFTEGGAATINLSGDNSGFTIGGETIHSSKINDGATITVDNGGSWSASIDMPITSATTTEGPRELKVTDSGGREGKVSVVFPDRAITITPAEGRVSTNVKVVGTGFPAKNNDGNSITVEVTYDAGGGGTNTATATPDASGRWEVSVQVPSDAAIPSTNTVKAEFDLFTANTASTTSGSTGITTVTHRVPRAAISLDKLSGGPGTTVRMTASGFKRFTPIQTLEVGDIDVTPSPNPATDSDGSVTFEFLIPGSDTGVQTVELNVGGTTASVGFTVTDETSFGDGVVIPIEDALAPLFDGNTLDRAFFFNNVTKEWQFHINDDAFSGANDLDDVASGQPIWIKVTESTSVELNGQTVDLTCVNAGTPEEDCWNLKVFP